jgi:hypothetical protein
MTFLTDAEVHGISADWIIPEAMTATNRLGITAAGIVDGPKSELRNGIGRSIFPDAVPMTPARAAEGNVSHPRRAIIAHFTFAQA